MEVIVAVGIMVMGIVSILILTSYNLTAAEYGENRLIASNLARESLEVIRNVRDSNWLAGLDWNNGLPDQYDDRLQIIDFSSNATGQSYTLSTSGLGIETCDACELYVPVTTFSHTVSNDNSGFRRLVEFRDVCDPDIGSDDNDFVIGDVGSCVSSVRVGYALKARVQWKASNGETREVAIEDRIFNWR